VAILVMTLVYFGSLVFVIVVSLEMEILTPLCLIYTLQLVTCINHFWHSGYCRQRQAGVHLSLTSWNTALCPRSVFVCFVWFSRTSFHVSKINWPGFAIGSQCISWTNGI
jgi:hypothetical protein